MQKPVRPALLLLLAGSAALRFLLIARGGQYYFPDEMRFERSVRLLESLRAFDLRGALDLLLSSPDHTGFVVLGLPAALLRGAFSGPPKGSAWAAAAFLSLASVATIGLVYRLARRLEASYEEALGASFLLACCTTFVFYSRHLVPYDGSMALGLAALDLGLGQKRPWLAFASGLVASAAFLTYNGYWMLALLALLIPRLRQRRISELWQLLLSSAGFVLPLLLLEGASLGRDEGYLAGLRRFSHTIVQSDMSEGWSLPFAYLWHAEHLLLGVLLLGLVLGIALAIRRTLPYRGWIWGGTALALYVCQVVFSVGLSRLSVYGRLVRQEVPFLCLLAAIPFAAMPRRWTGALGALLLGQAAFNLQTPLGQAFPLEVRNAVLAQYGEVNTLTSIVGPAQVDKGRRMSLLNARYLSPVLGVRPDPPGEVLFRKPHPLEYLPYQYEGFLPMERGILRATDISMRLVRGPKRSSDGSAGSP